MYRGRPRKIRRVGFLPRSDYFKPRGIPLSSLELIILSYDEAEVLRLIDVEGLDQNAVAEKMAVSRITVQRIYKSARRKVADAIINAKAIKIEKNNTVKYCRCPVGRRCGCGNNFLRGGE